ncbi:MAG: spondin domain-containing protein [Acidobacteriota bacterium]
MKTATLHVALAVVISIVATVPTHANSSGDLRVVVNLENLAPDQGTLQTPFWVGFHEGEFDTYNGSTPASSRPRPGSLAMESICEDGSTAAISDDFAALSFGIDATVPGPNGPIAPGETAVGAFLLDPFDADTRYFSYASMVLPSNDFCVSNGNPQAHPIFDDSGNFVAGNFFITGDEVLDAGTEVNDELPENTAFFGQMAPNTGVDEGGLIGDVGDLPDFAGFLPPDARLDPPTILGTPRFSMGDFTDRGYPIMKVSFAAAPAIRDDLDFVSFLKGSEQVPRVETRAIGFAHAELRGDGTTLSLDGRFFFLRNVTMAHLHLGPAGENGPVVVNLLDESVGSLRGNRFRRILSSAIQTGDLTGPLQGQPLDALMQEILDGNVYINIHTRANPSGELRGQLRLHP